MKTKHQLQNLKSCIKTFLMIGALLTSLNTYSGNPFLSLQVARDVSGSGLGSNFLPSLALTNNKSTFSIGPNFQSKKNNFSGMQLNYRYSAATNSNGKLELYFSGNFTIHSSAFMSAENADIEQASHPEETYNYSEMRLKVIEGYAGIGLKINPVKRISIGLGAGLGMFDTLNKDYDKEMYRQKSSLALQLKCVLIYNFKLGK